MEQFICKTCGKQFLSNSVNSYCRICYKKYREEREKKEEEAKNLKWQEQKKRNQALFEEEITKYSPALIEILFQPSTLYISLGMDSI